MLLEIQDEEGDESYVGTDRDSDAEFEQMLQEAEEASVKDNASDETAGGDENTTEAPKKKAKTKIGNKSKKKKKTKTTSKFPSQEGQDGYEVRYYNICVLCTLFF